MQAITTIIRAPIGFLIALAYQVATNPYVIAGLLVLAGHWKPATVLLGLWCLSHALAVAFSRWAVSPLTGHTIRDAPGWLWALGNMQDGYVSRQYMHPKWPWWLVAFTECAWRNKLRNLPWYPGLKWLHRPSGELREHNAAFAGLVFRIRTRGWLTEVEYFSRKRFGDFGPRLDQPDEWGGVSWAFRPWGRL